MLIHSIRTAILPGLLVSIMFLLSMACSEEPTLSLEKRAQNINKTLMCPVCPSETIDQSQVELAKQMRMLVLQKLRDGESEKDIFEYFASRYGDAILAEPPKTGFNLLVWIAPPIMLSVGAAFLYLVIIALRRNMGTGISDVNDSQKYIVGSMQKYLDQVDSEIDALEISGQSESNDKSKD